LRKRCSREKRRPASVNSEVKALVSSKSKKNRLYASEGCRLREGKGIIVGGNARSRRKKKEKTFCEQEEGERIENRIYKKTVGWVKEAKDRPHIGQIKREAKGGKKKKHRFP